MEQIKFPQFVHLPWWANVQQSTTDGTPIYKRSVVNINPMSVVYYYPLTVTIDEEEKELTSVSVGSYPFWIDMSFKEFDELWQTVKRSFDMDEDWKG